MSEFVWLDSLGTFQAFLDPQKHLRLRTMLGDYDLDEGEKDGYACLIAKYELSQGRTAGALSTLHARLKAAPSKKLAGEVADMYKALGWEHWASNAAEKLERDYPKASSPL